MVNGYVTLDLTSNNIYSESIKAKASGKPILVVDAPNVYFADTISIVSDDVVITKGGKTITITDANSVSSVGDIQEKVHLYVYSFDVTDSDTYKYYFNSIALPFNFNDMNELLNYLSEVQTSLVKGCFNDDDQHEWFPITYVELGEEEDRYHWLDGRTLMTLHTYRNFTKIQIL